MNRNKTFKKWQARVLNSWDAWTEQEINYFRKYIRQNQGVYKILADEFAAMTWDLQEKGMHGYKLTAEQSRKGTRYLLDKSLKKNGDCRKNNRLGEVELDILMNCPTHYLVGLWHINYGFHGELLSCLPVYRAVDKEGNWFEYTGTMYEQIMVFLSGKAA